MAISVNFHEDAKYKEEYYYFKLALQKVRDNYDNKINSPVGNVESVLFDLYREKIGDK